MQRACPGETCRGGPCAHRLAHPPVRRPADRHAVKLRPYRDADLAAVAGLFTAAVHALAAGHYDARQRAAWAPRPPDLTEWQARLNGPRTLVAEKSGELAGFITYEMDGHIVLLYASPRHASRGVASALYREAESALAGAGITELFTEASRVARPFFERQGYIVEEAQYITLRGVTLPRFAMRKSIGAAAQPG
jgi:putative acetyltransferase